MSHSQMWNQVLEHLRHAGLLEDLHIIAMGDMCQLPPPNQFVKPIYEDFVLAARKPTSYSSKPLVLAGIKSFQKLIKIELVIQNRSEDVEHTETIRKLRNGEIDDTFINNLKPSNDYAVDILITDPTVQRIQFNAGESSTILSGGIVRGESGPVYIFQANAQQLLNASITTLEENGSIDIVTPSGKIIAQDKKDIELPLPENGDYLMQVNPIRGNVSFEVTFKILSVPSN